LLVVSSPFLKGLSIAALTEKVIDGSERRNYPLAPFVQVGGVEFEDMDGANVVIIILRGG
jgi:hypothetical protein